MAKFASQMKGTYVDRAGYFMLEPTDNAGEIITTDTIVPKCVLQSITINDTRSEGELPDGNSPYPADTYIDTEGTTIDIVVSTADPYVDAWMRGAKLSALTEYDTFRAISEEVVLGTDKTATLAHTATKVIKAIGADGEAKTASLDTNGKLSVTDGQAGEVVLVTYDYTVTSGSKIEKEAMANYKAAVFTATNTVVNIGKSSRFATNVVIDQVVPSGDQTKEWKKDPSGGLTYSFKALAPRAGHKAQRILYADTIDE